MLKTSVISFSKKVPITTSVIIDWTTHLVPQTRSYYFYYRHCNYNDYFLLSHQMDKVCMTYNWKRLSAVHLLVSALIFYSDFDKRAKLTLCRGNNLKSTECSPGPQNGKRTPVSLCLPADPSPDTSHAGPPQWAQSPPLQESTLYFSRDCLLPLTTSMPFCSSR